MANRASTRVSGRGKAGSKKNPPMPSAQTTAKVARRRSDAPQAKTAAAVLQERHELIAQAAYFIAQRRGFAPGYEFDDWLQAEAEVEARAQARIQ